MSEDSVAEEKLIQLKDRDENLLYPKITLDSIDNGIIGKEKLNDEVKQKIDGIVITLNYSGRPREYEVGESSLSSSSAIVLNTLQSLKIIKFSSFSFLF